jgi:hypothetical protein
MFFYFVRVTSSLEQEERGCLRLHFWLYFSSPDTPNELGPFGKTLQSPAAPCQADSDIGPDLIGPPENYKKGNNFDLGPQILLILFLKF